MHQLKHEIQEYHNSLTAVEKEICNVIAAIIEEELPDAESKIWHAHPVWFINGNPATGYSRLKDCIRLMFWSGADFDEEKLQPGTGKFKDASIKYTDPKQIDADDLRRWLKKSRDIQWDYKNLIKRKGILVKLQ